MLRKILAMIPQDERHRSMWKNFSQSIGLLTIAMMAALYSSSVGRDGRLLAAVASASVALSISIWVGVRFVPRLAQGVDWYWLPFLSRYKVTQEGWMYFLAVVVVIFAAVNTSNNLLYMVLSALLAVLLLSGFLSTINFRFLDFDIRLPESCFVGQNFTVSLQVRNQKQIFPSFSIYAAPLDDSPFLFSKLYFPLVQARVPVAESSEAVLRRRGRHQINALRVSSRYPFGFFSQIRECKVSSECVCYPAIIPQDQMNLKVIDIQGSNQSFQRGVGFDLYMIRDYIQSDSARHVHWKASAKTATLKTREFAAEEGDRVLIAFDRFGTTDDSDAFEQMVSYAASIAVYSIRDGAEVAFVSDDFRSGFSLSLDPILTYLAEVEPSPTASMPNVDPNSGAVVLSLRGAARK
jgi:uncharacterized protein (DUF58 family)